MAIRSLCTILTGLSVAGCVTTGSLIWSHPQMTGEQFGADRNACIFEAKRATASYGPGPRAYSLADAIGMSVAQGLDINARQQDVFHACMLAKGYRPEGREPVARLVNPVAQKPASEERPPIAINKAAKSTAVLGGFHALAVESAMAAGCEPMADVYAGIKTAEFETYVLPCADGKRMPLFCDKTGCRPVEAKGR